MFPARGHVAGSPTAEARLAFRLGVRSVDLQIALAGGDTALANRLTTEITETLKGVAFTDLVSSSYVDLKTHLATESRAPSIDRASRAEHELRQLLSANPLASYSFGQWAGAAELAAQTHDASFFESTRGTSVMRSGSAKGILAADDIDALKAVDARVKQGTGPAFDEAQQILQLMIRRRGR